MNLSLRLLLTLTLIVTLAACYPATTSHTRTARVPAAERLVLPRESASRPNVVLILADDLGINDISLNALDPGGADGPPIRTPNIDRIGREGVAFTQAFASHATCAPSRAGLLTGRYQHRFGFEFNPGASGRLAQLLAARQYLGIPALYFPERIRPGPPQEVGLPVEELTLAELLQRSGYRTAHFGKWHLGMAPQFVPQNHGFDLSVGFYQGASRYAPPESPDVVNAPLPIDEPLWDMFPYTVLRNGEPVRTTQYQTDLWADEAVRFISESSERPFFAFLAFNAPHNPLQATRETFNELGFIENHEERVYYAMVLSLDRAIGRVLDALEDTGKADNTIVIFASDNGGAEYTHIWTHNLPLRGYKGTFWEGGVRTPLFIRWPAALGRGSRFDGQTSLLDLFATIATAAGADLPSDRIYDSVDLWPFLAGGRTGHPHYRLFWRSGEYEAVRDPLFKFKQAPRPEPGNQWLYASSIAMEERNNLVPSRRDLVRFYQAILADHFGRMEAPRWNVAFELPVRADPPASNEDLTVERPEFVYVSGG